MEGTHTSLVQPTPYASLPKLTAHVLLASPVDRQHIQRVEDGAVGTHGAGVPVPEGGTSGRQDPPQATAGGGSAGGPAHLPLRSSSASSSGM